LVKPTIKKAMDYEDYSGWDNDGDEEDSYEQDVREKLIEFFEKNQKKVFFSRQLEVKLEDNYFHWITNRAIRALIVDGGGSECGKGG